MGGEAIGLLGKQPNPEPLHVQVAEALGCKPDFYDGRWWCHCGDSVTRVPVHGYAFDCGLRHYDTQWSAAGPLVEKYVTTLVRDDVPDCWIAYSDEMWDDTTEKHDAGCDIAARGATALEAVCRLILALKEAGKL